MISGAKTLFKLCWKAAEGTKIFLKISQEMNVAGFEKTGQQCSGKIKKLRFDYRKIKDCRGKTGRGREWKFFEAMDAVLGHKPATCHRSTTPNKKGS